MSSTIESIYKYRPESNVYDKYDELYALELQRHFSKLNSDLQIRFNLCTYNVMDEKYINRYKLLDAIEDFKKTEDFINYFSNNDNEDNENNNDIKYKMKKYEWNHFCDQAFNYRPWQPCVIM